LPSGLKGSALACSPLLSFDTGDASALFACSPPKSGFAKANAGDTLSGLLKILKGDGSDDFVPRPGDVASAANPDDAVGFEDPKIGAVVPEPKIGTVSETSATFEVFFFSGSLEVPVSDAAVAEMPPKLEEPNLEPNTGAFVPDPNEGVAATEVKPPLGVPTPEDFGVVAAPVPSADVIPNAGDAAPKEDVAPNVGTAAGAEEEPKENAPGALAPKVGAFVPEPNAGLVTKVGGASSDPKRGVSSETGFSVELVAADSSLDLNKAGTGVGGRACKDTFGAGKKEPSSVFPSFQLEIDPSAELRSSRGPLSVRKMAIPIG